jgi:hypothetical protein
VPAVRIGEEGGVKKVSTLIPRLLKGLGLEEAARFERIRKEWSAIFREPLSLHMSPSSLKNGELLIAVDSPVWLQQISLFKPDIAKNLTAYGVTDVRFRIGRIVKPAGGVKRTNESSPRQWPSLGRDDLREIDETVSGLKDSALRENVRRAMEQSLRRTAGKGTRRED